MNPYDYPLKGDKVYSQVSLLPKKEVKGAYFVCVKK